MAIERGSAAALGILAALSLAGAAIVLLATSHGPGIAPNSVIYISAAEHVDAGDGFIALSQQGGVRPLEHYPPLLSFLMAAGGAAGFPLIETARWLNAAAFTLSTFLIGLLLLESSGSLTRAVMGSVIFLTALQSLEIHAFVLSEPVFMTLLLLAVAALARHIDTGRLSSLGIAAGAMALAGLARYAGAAFGAMGAIGILLLAHASLRARIGRAVIFGAAAIGPQSLWMLRSMLDTETLANRHLAVHLITRDQIEKGIHTLAGWVGPQGMPAGLKAIVAAAVVACAVVSWVGGRRRPSGGASSREPVIVMDLAALGIAAYMALLFFSMTFVDAATPLTRRILSPVFALGLVLVIGGFRSTFMPSRLARAVGPVAAILLAGIALFSSARAYTWVREARRDGLGYASVRWRNSELIEAVRELPRDLTLRTNAVEAIYYLAGRVSDELPSRTDKYSKAVSGSFEKSLDAVAAQVSSGRAAVVWVEGMDRAHLAALDELEARMGRPTVTFDGEGAIFR